MNRRYIKKKSSKIKEIILSHLENNVREYLIITIIFLIGIILGVIFINNVSEDQHGEITNYILTFINGLKENKTIDDLAVLKNSIQKNCVLAFVLWFMGSTVIGISVAYLIVCFRGFCLGYTISSIILSLRNSEKELYFYFPQFYYKIFCLFLV